MKRSPLKRGKSINRMSKKKRLQIADEKAVREGYLIAHYAKETYK